MALGRKLARLSVPVSPPRPAARAPEPAPPPESAPPAEPARSSRLLDDLRAKMDAILSREPVARRVPALDQPDLPFQSEETPHGTLHRRVLRLPPSHRVGRASVLPSRSADPGLLALLALDPALAACPPSGALYLDTETTGLAGGTGTVAFLVGLAFWDPDPQGDGRAELVVEQLLVRNLGEEAPMLAHVAARVRAASMLVTFNGKSFDMPLLRTRFVLARMEAPPEPPHLDLRHVARRIHKARGVQCRLIGLEDKILGFVRQDDVPSGDVSACYLHFLRTGETAALLGVVEHNLWDVVTMASLLGLYGEPLEGSALAGDDLAGAARVLRRAGAHESARAFAEAAVDRGGGTESLRARAEIAKVLGDRARALRDFHAVLEREDDPRVRLELAKIYEHHERDLARALVLTTLGTGESDEARGKRRRRIEEKLARSRRDAPLFEAASTRKR